MVSRYATALLTVQPVKEITLHPTVHPVGSLHFRAMKKDFFKTININAPEISENINKRKTVHTFYQSHHIKVAQGSSSFSVLFLYDLIKYFFVLSFVFYQTDRPWTSYEDVHG